MLVSWRVYYIPLYTCSSCLAFVHTSFQSYYWVLGSLGVSGVRSAFHGQSNKTQHLVSNLDRT